eukprot:scaffold74150_cov57-Phaeocystis_antarctica.AAC.5
MAPRPLYIPIPIPSLACRPARTSARRPTAARPSTTATATLPVAISAQIPTARACAGSSTRLPRAVWRCKACRPSRSPCPSPSPRPSPSPSPSPSPNLALTLEPLFTFTPT